MDIYDLVIKNGTIVDPEKKYINIGQVGVNGTKISIITDDEISGKVEIDAKGMIVCPGFIDIHGHIDGHIECAELSALQGVTTTIGGNCGLSPLDLKKFFQEQSLNGFPINQAQLVGHSFTLRKAAGIESPYVPATKNQITHMCELLEKSIKDGAIGLSFGLEYAPGSSIDEIIALSTIAAKYKMIIPIHTNLNMPGDLTSLIEAVRISEVTGAHVLISHFVYQYGMGLMTEALDIVDKAREKGLKVSADSGMYTAFATFIGSTIYDEEYMKRFGWKLEDLLASTGKYKGKRLTPEIYRELRNFYKDDSVICFTGVESEIYEALLKDYIMVSSDTGPSPTGNAKEGHPQNAGTFPRFFRKMVREQKSISLLEAIEKCTLLPANTIGLTDKGRMAAGTDADIVIFDINKIKDKAEFPDRGEPDEKPEGIYYVIVNGKIVVREGNLVKGSLPGKIIRNNRFTYEREETCR